MLTANEILKETKINPDNTIDKKVTVENQTSQCFLLTLTEKVSDSYLKINFLERELVLA